ncbi:Phosphoribosylformylglycinamidine cyclo-ligase, partial [Bienertia sinuspersici]
MLRKSEEVNELEELEVISEESSNTIKLLDANNDSNEFSKEWLSSLPVKCKDPVSFSITCRIGTNHTLAMVDNTELKIVGLLNNALIHVKNLFFLDDFYVIDTKHESTILLGRPFLKSSKYLIYVANGSVLEILIPKANATDYVANSLEQIGVDNLETILDGMVADI